MKITKTQIKEISDSRSWERGLNYHNCGNVLSILEDENMIIGKVQGTHKYNVKLWLEDGELDGSCDCPMGDAGVFCKHCIATALTYIEGEVDSAKSHSQSKQSKKSRPSITIKDIRKYLSSQE